MRYQQGRYHVITWDHDNGEDDKGDFSTKAKALQDMRLRVKVCGHDGAVVFDRYTQSVVAVYGDYPRFAV